MALDVDKFLDRRRLKRSRGWWRLVAIIALISLALFAFGRFYPLESGSYVAVLDIRNLIVDDPDRNGLLKEISEDPEVKALIVRISSPGGTVMGAEALFFVLRMIAEKKPVVAVMRELATSAGYMISLGADYIIARHSTITGSIGVLMQSADLTGLMEKLGIKPQAIKSSPLKAQPNPLEPFTNEARKATEKIITDIHSMFVDLVAERRKLERSKASVLSDGRIYTGRQAVANGLIDALGGEDEARDWLDKNKGISKNIPLRVVTVRRDKIRLREFFGDLIGKTLLSERLRLDGLISLWHPNF